MTIIGPFQLNLFYSIPFHSIPFRSIPFHSYSILFYSILFYSILFYSIPVHSKRYRKLLPLETQLSGNYGSGANSCVTQDTA